MLWHALLLIREGATAHAHLIGHVASVLQVSMLPFVTNQFGFHFAYTLNVWVLVEARRFKLPIELIAAVLVGRWPQAIPAEHEDVHSALVH